VQHRHVSHLHAAYPGDQITRRGTPELAAAVRKTLERRGDNHGWSAAWKINLYARLGDAESAYRVLREMETEISIHPSKEDSDRVPSMEGNQGIQAYTADVVETLLQSHAGARRLHGGRGVERGKTLLRNGTREVCGTLPLTHRCAGGRSTRQSGSPGPANRCHYRRVSRCGQRALFGRAAAVRISAEWPLNKTV
jgi:hypothetical protein